MLHLKSILVTVCCVTICAAYRRPPGLRHSHHYHGAVHNYFSQTKDAVAEDNDNTVDRVTCKKEEKIYRFQIGDNFGPYEYTDAIDGTLRGFHVDLVKAICEEAEKTCYPVMDIYSNCWDTDGNMEIPGKGLMGGWYDGCVGLTPSPERLNSFNFSLAYTPNTEATLFYREGQDQADMQNLTGKRIGFIKGWSVGLRCLSRQLDFIGNLPRRFTPVGFEAHEAMITALQLEDLDAVLTVTSYIPERLKLNKVEPLFQCTTAGISMMARYGDDVINWWNEAFLALKSSGKFQSLCEASQKEHGLRGIIECIQ